MTNAPYPILNSKTPAVLKPGTKYLIRAPLFAQNNTQITTGQTGATVILTLRRSRNQVKLDVGYGSTYVLDGTTYESVQLSNVSSTEQLYLYESILLDNEVQTVISKVSGDYFNGIVAAATAKTDRTTILAPANNVVPLYLNYSLSAGGDITGTAGDDWYIALINSDNDTQNIVVNRGTVVGSLRTVGGQHWNIEYLNNDTVAHRMSASFHFVVGKY